MRRIMEHAKAHRLLAVLLCLCMVLPSLSGIGSIPRIVEAADTSPKTPGASKYVADPITMESYQNVLNLDVNSRNAGRLWMDKSVSVGDITLSEADDGVNATITNSSDFLHAFSVLGSSQEMIGVPPTRTVIVFDNSGTMYASPKADNISGTRIGKTVEAINRAIDSLMAASQYNEVAVVLFGNGETDSNKKEIQKNTAVTILPMAHYAPNQQEIADKGYTSYINASWGSLEASSSGQMSGGFVSVERKMLPKTDADYASSGTVSYANGTTNIDAGIYQGMKELLEVEKKTVTLGTETYQYVPAMVVLTDGSATDSLTGPFSNPVMESYGLVNEPGNKFQSFIQDWYNPTAKSNGKTWEQFVHFNAVTKKYEQIGWNEGQKEEPYQTKKPNDQWLEAMKDFADTYRSTHKYMLLHTLMTAAYHKAAVEKAYGDTALSVYSVSVDITSPATVIKDHAEDTITEESLNNGKDYITTNGPTMNPGMYFNKTWLKDAGYITRSDVTNATKLGWEDTVYNNKQPGGAEPASIKGYNTGSAIILGMTDAYDAYTEWEKGNSAGTFKYQSWSEIHGLMTEMKSERLLTEDLFKGHGGLLNDGKHELSIKDITTIHDNAYYARPVQDRSENFPHLTGEKTDDNPYGLTDEDVKKNINYIKRAYYAETAIEGADQIKSAFEEIINEINQPVFTPVGGKNDLDAEDAVTYMDPMGKYMEVKDVDSIVLFGQRYGEVKAAVFDYRFYSAHNDGGEFKEGWYGADDTYDGSIPTTHSKNGVWDEGWTYYIGPNTARQFVSSIPETGEMEAEQNSKFRNTIYTIYRLDLESTERDKLRMNPAYGTDAELEAWKDNKTIQDTDPKFNSYYTNFDGVYKLSDIRVWVEDTGNYNDTLVDSSGIMSGTGYDEALFVNVPVSVVPIRKVTIDYSESNGEYRTNKGAASHEDLPFRLFYDVGIQSDLMTEDGHSVDMTKLSAGYLDHYKIITEGNKTQWNNNKLEANQLLSEGDVFFFSNWYSEARYDGYQTTTQDYTYGDPVVSFSPSIKNRYYFFQKPLPLYQKAYEYTGGKWQEIQNPATWTGGKGLEIAESLPSTGKEGQVVVVKSDLIKEKKSLSKDGYYYLLIEYYENVGGKPEPVQYVVSRKGTELGLGEGYGASITADEMLCWYNTDQTASVAYRPYGENPGNGWVIAVKTGGLRTGEMQGEVTGKGDGLGYSNGYYEGNKTRTSNNVYLPTVSPSSTLQGGKVTINEYLGNNGRLAISDTLMLVKKTVLDNSEKIADGQKEEKFGYIIEIKGGGTSAASGYNGFTDLRNAIVVTRNDDDSNIWRRRIEYIDLVLSNRGYLQYSAANGSGEVEVDQNGEPKQGGGYYVYLRNNLADGETGNGNVYRIYRSNLENGGVSEGVDADAKEGISTFSLTKYSLVPVEYADAPEGHMTPGTGKIPVIRYDPTDPNSTAIQVTSEQGYEFETVYLTKSLYFGTEGNGGGALPEGFEVPAGWPWIDGEKKAVAPPKNMSYFELSDGEGLLFSGMPSGTQYCVTEILSEENKKNGFGFTRALHNYASDKTSEYTSEKYVSTSGKYRVPTQNYGSTSAYEESIHFINGWNNSKKETEVNGQHVDPMKGEFYPSVKVGDLITYEIDWNNNATKADGTADSAHVTIEDLLDEGVNFSSASVSGVSGAELTAGNKSVSGQLNGAPFEISYDEDSRTVSWDLGEQPGAAKGTVKLVVEVNEKAEKYWNYDVGADGKGSDFLVRNRALIQVGENQYYTNIVKNPVGEPDKTETQIEHDTEAESYDSQYGGDKKTESVKEGDNLNPRDLTEEEKAQKESVWTGPVVFEGDRIKYRIDWMNYEDSPADVIIRDPLDKNVSFVSAAYTGYDGKPVLLEEPGTKEYEETEKPTKDIGGLIHIKYDQEKHEVTWTLRKRAGVHYAEATGKSLNAGYVELVVQVEDGAVKAGQVENTAWVKVNDNPEQQTKTVENPTPNPKKEEVTPGNGAMVGIGDEITYEIDWRNYRTGNAKVVITDKLDPGVDFVSAALKGDGQPQLKPNSDNVNGTLNGGTYTISYNDKEHLVTWDLGEQPRGAAGTVELVVKTNNKARENWDYNSDATDEKEELDEAPDNRVVNQARVQVGNHSDVTEKPENPIPSKTETKIEAGEDGGTNSENPDLEEKEGTENTYTGPLVYVDDVITYEISWKNALNENANVIITDPLDPGVDYVDSDNGGVYDDTNRTVTWTLQNQAPGASGKVTLRVKVNEKATPKGKVDNQAIVQVGNNPAVKTETIENPTPKVEKVEKEPGEGSIVSVGSIIDYVVTWRNYEKEAATVTITDKLDPGSDFLKASFGDVELIAEDNAKQGNANLAISLDGDEEITDGLVFILKLFDADGKALTGTYAWEKTGAAPQKEEEAVLYAQDLLEQKSVPEDQPEETEGTTSAETGETESAENEVTNSAEDKPAESEETGDAGSKETGETETQKTGETESEETGETETQKTGETKLKETGETGTGEIGETESQETGETESEETGETGIQKIGETKLKEIGETGTGETGETESRGTGETESEETEDQNVETGEWSAENQTIELAPGQTVVIKDLPVGATYELTQTLNDEFKVEGRIGKDGRIIEIRAALEEAGDGNGSGNSDGTETGSETSGTGNADTEANGTGSTGTEANGTGSTDTEVNGTGNADTEANGTGGTGTEANGTGSTGTEVDDPGNGDSGADTTDPANGNTASEADSSGNGDTNTETSGTESAGDGTEGDGTGSTEPIAAYSSRTIGLAVQFSADGIGQSAPLEEKAEEPEGGDNDSEGNPSGNGAAENGSSGGTVETESFEGGTTETESSEASTTETESSEASTTETESSEEGTTETESSEEGTTETESSEEGTTETESSEEGTTETESSEEGTTETESSEEGTTETESSEEESTETESSEEETTETEEGAEGESYSTSVISLEVIVNASTAEVEKIGEMKTRQSVRTEGVITATGEDAYGEITITYDPETHTVTWVLKNRPEEGQTDSEGEVALRVRVNEDAEKFWSYEDPDAQPSDTKYDERVRNQAGVKVGNNPEVKTRVIENPMEPEKRETQINGEDVSGEQIEIQDGNGNILYRGPAVGLYDEITYTITWQNDAVDETGEPVAANVSVADQLDPNVEYVEASDGGRYNSGDHTVTWDLGSQEARACGEVWVKVRVKKEALEKGEVVNGASVTVGNKTKQTNKVENPTKETGSLVVSKTVTGEEGDRSREFHFTVKLSESISGTYGDMTFENGTAQLWLKHGESKKAEYLPAGIIYTVTEETVDGYTVRTSGAAGQIPAGGEATAGFENYKEPTKGSLTVRKIVSGDNAEYDRNFHFTVELSDSSISGTYGDMAFRDGRADIELKHGESRTATGLPGGITYTVHEQEADQDGYSTGSTGSRGTIPTGETAYAEFTNARNKEPETPPPGTEPETPPPGKKPGTGSLTVMKSVQGEGYNGETFTFVVKLTDSSINGTYGGMTFVGGEAAFSLGDGGSITADGLPEGVGFAVVEADANQNGYVTYATGDSGVITAGENSAVGFVNQKKPEESDEPGPGDDNGNLGDRRGNLGDRRGNLGARTGDESHVEAWVVLLLAAIALGAGVILYRKKKK